MKIIRITVDNQISTHEFPQGSYEKQNRFLRRLIGNGCDIYEHVMPVRLYTDFKMVDHPTQIPGQCVSMLIDEEGRLKENVPNQIGSYLYKTDKHGCPIMGNILFVGEEWGEDGIDFCGIEDSVRELLELKLNDLIFTMKATKEALSK